MGSLIYKGLDEFAKGIERMGARAAKYAARDGANDTAFEARKVWAEEIRGSMVLRNRWTTSSLRVEKAKLGPIESMAATLGSLAEYMDEQEEGAPQQIGGKRAIPTGAAAGQPGARRTKVVRAPNRISAIEAHRGKGKTSGQRNVRAIKSARAMGKKFVLLEGKRGPGIFRLGGGTRKPKVQMMWSLAHGSRPIPKNPTLGPTIEIMTGRAPAIYLRAVVRETNRAFKRKLGLR